MKNKSYYVKVQVGGIIIVLGILFLELLIDHFVCFSKQWLGLFCLNYNKFGAISFYSVTGLIIIVTWMNRKLLNFIYLDRMKNILKMLIKNSLSGNVVDLLFIFFFLFHLAWIPDSIYDFIRNGSNIIHPIIYILGLFLVLGLKPECEKIAGDDSLVLVTGISNIAAFNIAAFLHPIKENNHLQKILIFVDKRIQVDKQESSIKKLNELGVSENTLLKLSSMKVFNSHIIKKIITEIVGKNTSIKLIKCDYDKLKAAHSIVYNEIEKLLFEGYSDCQILFNLTPGTKNISIALALNSLKGNRKICYFQQNEPKEFIITTIGAKDITDILEDLRL